MPSGDLNDDGRSAGDGPPESSDSSPGKPGVESLEQGIESLNIQVGSEVELVDSVARDPGPPARPAHEAEENYSDVLVEFRIADMLEDRYNEKGDIADLDRAIALYYHGYQVLPSTHPGSQVALGSLATLLHTRFKECGEAVDLHNAIVCGRKMREFYLPDNPVTYVISGASLAPYLLTRFRATDDLAALDESISLLENAIAAAPPNSTQLQVPLSNLGQALDARFHRFERFGDINRAIDMHRAALALRPRGHPSRGFSLHNLASALHSRYQYMVGAAGTSASEKERLGSEADLGEADALYAEAIQVCPPGANNRAQMLMHRAMILETRFERTGDLDDINAAIDIMRQTLNLRPEGDPERSASLESLSGSLRLRFALSGDVTDIEDSVLHCQEALDCLPESHPHRPLLLHHMGLALWTQYEASADTKQVRDAIALLRQAALECPPERRLQRSIFLSDLASVLRVSFTAGAGRAQMDETIALYEEAASLLPAGRAPSTAFLNGHAGALHARFEEFRDRADLEEAVRFYEAALEREAENPEHQITARFNLASALETRMAMPHSSALDDCVRTVDLLREALRFATPGHASRSNIFFHLASVLLLPRTPVSDLGAAFEYHMKAVTDESSGAQARLTRSMRVLAMLEVPAEAHPERRMQLLEAYQLTLRLLPRVAYLGLHISKRLGALAESETLANYPAVHALALGQLSTAIEVLEEGRGVFWAQSLRLRTPFDQLPTELAQRLEDASCRLEMESFESFESVIGDDKQRPKYKSFFDAEAAQRRRRSEEFDNLVKEARTLPGFETFMLQEPYEKLSRAAEKGPVVVLVPSLLGCHAVVIRTSESSPEGVPLADISMERIRVLADHLRQKNRYQREMIVDDRALEKVTLSGAASSTLSDAPDVLKELWLNVLTPVLTTLGLKRSQGRDRPRLWWCLIGVFSFLPIHAAGDYYGNGECCSDYFVSSYTPTLGALVKARKEFAPPSRSSTKILLAAVPQPHEGSWLPSVRDEVFAVQSTVPGDILIPLSASDDCLVDPRSGATISTVLTGLPQATILHLACHGQQHPTNPLQSGFILRDGTLTVERLMAMRLPRAFLAFLSACETAKGDQTQPDQTVHLAAAMLFAGFKSIVGTMWSMGDVDGPVVAKRLYEELFSGTSGNLDTDAVPYALDTAVQELKNRGLHPSRWACFVHIGV